MSWLRIDDNFVENPKVADLKDRSFRLHVAALCYCARNLTDGNLDARAVRVVCAITGATKRNLVELVEAGLWRATDDGGHEINDYLEFNPPAQKVKRDREQAKQRMGKNRAVRAGSEAEDVDYRTVYDRDGGICRICGFAVDYSDAEFDHIVPISAGGPHTFDNLAATHRRCNRTKRTQGAEFTRTPHRTETRTSDVGSVAPLPSRPVPEVSDLSAPTSYEGHEEKLWKRLCIAAGARNRVDIGKLERAVKSRGSTEREIQCAIEAATGPGVRDPLAVALSELVKRSDERRAA